VPSSLLVPQSLPVTSHCDGRAYFVSVQAVLVRITSIVAAVECGPEDGAVFASDAAWLVETATGVDSAAAKAAWDAMDRVCRSGGDDKSNRCQLVDTGALFSVETMLTRSDVSADVVAACLRALAGLCGDGACWPYEALHTFNVADKRHVCALGMLVSATMERLKTSADVASSGCRALWRIHQHTRATGFSVRGEVAVVLAAMQHHAGVAGVQENGCGALRLLLPDQGAAADMLGDVIDAVVAAMALHPDVADVQLQGVLTVLHFSGMSSESVAAVARAGGIAAVMSAMRCHERDVDVQENGCRALFRLANSSARAKAIVDAGGTELALAASYRLMGKNREQRPVYELLHRLSETSAPSRRR
jgi:hypothetical protein